jgi:ABC-type ATPase with predicted acetyltransferase domain
MNPEDVKRFTFTIVPTIRKNPFAQNSYYKFAQYEEEGRPTGLPEPEIDVTEAKNLLAQFTLKR